MVDAETAKQLVALGFVACGGGDWMARVGRDQRRIIWRAYPRHPDYGKYIADPDEGGAWDDPLNPRFTDPVAAAVWLLTTTHQLVDITSQ